MSTVNVLIVKKPGAWILDRYHAAGSVVKVEARLAKEHLAKVKDRDTGNPVYKITDKAAKVDSTKPPVESDEDKAARLELEAESRDKSPSEIYELDFPGKDDLLKVGISTIKQLDQFIADNGDAWFKKVNGIGAKTAKEIVAFREKQK